jgi:hypothetical protein
VYNRVTQYIRKRIDDGAFRSDVDPAVAARSLVGMAMHHATVQALFKDTIVTANTEEYAVEMVRIFLAGMERR